MAEREAEAIGAAVHGPCLALAMAIMIGLTAYPPLMQGADGHVDHGALMLVMWAMSAGFVRGVGFIPRARVWRLIFSGYACIASLALALLLPLMH